MDFSVLFRNQNFCCVRLVHPNPSVSDARIACGAELDVIGAALRIVAHDPRRRAASVDFVEPGFAVAADAQCVQPAITGDAVTEGVAVGWRTTFVVG